MLADNEELVLLAQTGGSFPGTDTTPSDKVSKVETSATPFSLRQQWKVPRLLRVQAKSCGTRAVYHSSYYLMPYRIPCPALLTIYDTISLTYPETVSFRARTLFRLTTMLALRASVGIITISDATRRDLETHFTVDPKRVTTIYLGVDEAFRPRPKQEQENVRVSFRQPGDFLLYFGSNKPHKNLVRLVDAYALLAAQCSRENAMLPSLLIAGAWDDQYPEAKQQVAHHRLGDRIRFLGPIDDADLPALYSAAMAFVFPSLYEGFGLPVLEAMACGVPVACSAASSLPEVAGDAAFYFDPKDVGSIALALRALIGDSALRANLSQRGLQRASEFTWRSTASKTLDLYRSVYQ